MRYLRILQAVAGMPWAIHAEKGRMIVDFLMSKARGIDKTAEEIQAAKAMARNEPVQDKPRQQSIAVLPVSSVILPRAHDITDSSMGPSGGQSAEMLSRMFSRFVNDDDVSAIVLDIDSPGGAVGGVPELFETVFAARGQKHVVAVANHFCASAAYWLGCAAGEFVMTPSAMVGSVGVYTYHEDISQLLADEGVKPTFISSSPEKVEDARQHALTDGARAHLQAVVDTYASTFIRDVARGRGVTEVDVRQNFGNGRMYQSEYAVAHNMVDRIATLDEVISGLRSDAQRRDSRMAQRRRRLAMAG